MELFVALAIPILITTAWLYTAQMTRHSLPTLRNKRICLLIAHPDDEAMFFSPTVIALTKQAAGNHIKILCLSSGPSIHVLYRNRHYSDPVALQEMRMVWVKDARRSLLFQRQCLAFDLRQMSWSLKILNFQIA